ATKNPIIDGSMKPIYIFASYKILSSSHKSQMVVSYYFIGANLHFLSSSYWGLQHGGDSLCSWDNLFPQSTCFQRISSLDRKHYETQHGCTCLT
ncbi:unnamed protein product, partial [Sphenostylis stenocarpa]